MAKIVLEDVASGFNLQKINSNFDKIEQALNTRVLYRDNPEDEPNSMQSTLDMNSQDLINVKTLQVNNLDIGGVNLGAQVALAQQYANDAAQSSAAAAATVVLVQGYAADAQSDADDAAQSALDAQAAQAAAEAVVASVDIPTIVRKTGANGATINPAGTTAQRPVSPVAGYTRFNTTLVQLETYNGTAWVPAGQGATGAVGNPAFYENDITVTGNYTLTTGKNAMSAGPITVNSGIIVTVPSGQTWSVV